MTVDPGSFRDPASRVFYSGGRVFRGLSHEAATVDERARSAGLVDGLVVDGLLVANWRTDEAIVPDGVPSEAIVESRMLPVISHPGEWSFPMLRDAALVTLETNLAALAAGFILKDASAFNVAFDGSVPIVLDVSSLDPIEGHSVWTAYGQFVDHFLAPLMLEAYTGMPFQSVLTSSLVGFPVTSLDRLLRGRRRYRRGVTTHVRMRSQIERRTEEMAIERRSEVASLSLPPTAIESTIRKMRDLVARLESPNSGHWEGYENALPYEAPEVESKRAFVARATERVVDGGLALDVGANEGLFTAILADRFDTVVAVDSDPGVVGTLYESLKGSDSNRVTPLVVDILNPSPPFGLGGRERSGFLKRIRPCFSTWLAVIHHLCIGQGVPLAEIVSLIAGTSAESVVEFVDLHDPMVKRISASRPESLDGYSLEDFEMHLTGRFDIVDVEKVSPTRTMYHLVRLIE